MLLAFTAVHTVCVGSFRSSKDILMLLSLSSISVVIITSVPRNDIRNSKPGSRSVGEQETQKIGQRGSLRRLHPPGLPPQIRWSFPLSMAEKILPFVPKPTGMESRTLGKSDRSHRGWFLSCVN